MGQSIANSTDKVNYSESKIQEYLMLLKKIPFFSKCENTELLTDIISNAYKAERIKERDPYDLVWSSSLRDKDAIAVVIKGLLTVHYEESINVKGNQLNYVFNFIKEGGVLGEFEFVQVKSRAKEIRALAKSIVVFLTGDDVKKIKKEVPEEFNKYIINGLISKLYDKNFLIEVHLKSKVTDRLIYLLRYIKEFFPQITIPIGNDKNSYLIDILFSDQIVMALLYTEFAKVRESLKELLENKLIKIHKFSLDKDGEFKTDRYNSEITLDYIGDISNKAKIRSKCQKNKNTRIQFEVIDYSKMVSYKSRKEKNNKN